MSNTFLQLQMRVMELTKLVAETYKENEEGLKQKAFKDIRKITLKTQSNENYLKQYTGVLKKTKDFCYENDGAVVEEIYEKELEQSLEYGDTNYVDQFDDFVSNLADGDIICDESIIISEVQQIHLDPWTKMKIRNPVKSAICRHVYELDSIKNQFKLSSMQCPYVGCRAVLKKNDLIYPED